MTPSDPCHIKTRGSGGDDIDSNLLPFCRAHHAEQGTIGFFKMCEKYPFLRQILAQKGFEFNSYKQIRSIHGHFPK